MSSKPYLSAWQTQADDTCLPIKIWMLLSWFIIQDTIMLQFFEGFRVQTSSALVLYTLRLYAYTCSNCQLI